jgi:hypothetical protein
VAERSGRAAVRGAGALTPSPVTGSAGRTGGTGVRWTDAPGMGAAPRGVTTRGAGADRLVSGARGAPNPREREVRAGARVVLGGGCGVSPGWALASGSGGPAGAVVDAVGGAGSGPRSGARSDAATGSCPTRGAGSPGAWGAACLATATTGAGRDGWTGRAALVSEVVRTFGVRAGSRRSGVRTGEDWGGAPDAGCPVTSVAWLGAGSTEATAGGVSGTGAGAMVSGGPTV